MLPHAKITLKKVYLAVQFQSEIQNNHQMGPWDNILRIWTFVYSTSRVREQGGKVGHRAAVVIFIHRLKG